MAPQNLTDLPCPVDISEVPHTLKSYQAALGSFLDEFAGRQIGGISTEDILSYLNRVTEGKKPQTRRIRYAHLSAFFNFIRNNLDPESMRYPSHEAAFPEKGSCSVEYHR